jgi:hypothetical protein
MSLNRAAAVTHPKGDARKTELGVEPDRCTIESYAGKVHIRWDETAMGQMPVFIDFLKTSGLLDGFVKDCPLRYKSPNAQVRSRFWAHC